MVDGQRTQRGLDAFEDLSACGDALHYWCINDQFDMTRFNRSFSSSERVAPPKIHSLNLLWP